jgi:hypothetical protein
MMSYFPFIACNSLLVVMAELPTFWPSNALH